jgi:hypothetical protein
MNREKEVLPKIRRFRLRDLVDQKAHGNAAEFARMHGMQQSHFSRYVTMSQRSGLPIGYTVARNLERTIGLESGYLDDESSLPGWQARKEFHDDPASDDKTQAVIVDAISRPPAPSTRAARAPANDIVQALSAIAGTVPPDRTEVVTGLMSAILTTNPPNPVFGMLLREELAKHST